MALLWQHVRAYAQHQRVTSGDTTLNGHAYIGAIKIRGNLVATALRLARGRPHTDIRCDCSSMPEALSHILQSCPRTHASRIARHDKIVDLVMSCAEKIGYGIRREPAIPTPAGIRKPDLVLVRHYNLTILDVTIVADNTNLEKAHHDKQVYYDVPAIREWPNHAMSLGTLPLRLWQSIGAGFWPQEQLRR